MNNNTTLCIHPEIALTSNGIIRHGNRRPIVAVDLYKTFNSIKDFASELHVDANYVSTILNRKDGKVKKISYYERDENGNKVGRKKWCRICYAAHSASSMDMMMECGRESNEQLNKANENNAKLAIENTKLKDENELLRKENNELQNAKSIYQDTIESLVREIKNRKRLRDRALEEARLLEASITEAEAKLNNMIWGE